jgi:hypothetical protein
MRVTKDLVSLFQYSDFELSKNVTDKSNDYIVNILKKKRKIEIDFKIQAPIIILPVG